MKNLTQLFKIILISFLTFHMNGQIKWGVQTGLNGTDITQSYSKEYQDDWNMKTKLKFGFNLGVLADYSFNDQMGIQSGLFFTQKGYQIDLQALAKENGDDSQIDGYWKYTYNYLQLPLHFYFNINNIYLSAGPYFAYGLSGTSKLDATSKFESDSERITQTDKLQPVIGPVKSDDYMSDQNVEIIKVFNALDYGVDLGVGYKYQQYMLKAQYSIGFSNLIPGISDYPEFDPNDLKQTNKGFNISLIYFFN